MVSRQTLPVFKKHSLVCFWKIPTTGVGPLFTVVSGSVHCWICGCKLLVRVLLTTEVMNVVGFTGVKVILVASPTSDDGIPEYRLRHSEPKPGPGMVLEFWLKRGYRSNLPSPFLTSKKYPATAVWPWLTHWRLHDDPMRPNSPVHLGHLVVDDFFHQTIGHRCGGTNGAALFVEKTPRWNQNWRSQVMHQKIEAEQIPIIPKSEL